MKTKFKTGQTVWCIRKGQGSVVDAFGTEDDGTVAVLFKLKSGENITYDYTGDGKWFRSDEHRSLYFSEPQVTAETEPQFVPTVQGKTLIVRYKKDSSKIGQIVIVKTEDKDRISVCLVHNSQNVFYMDKQDYKYVELSQVELTAFT